MKYVLNKILANILVIMVMMLPLRVMAMPIDMSPSHCMGDNMMGEMTHDMTGMQHEGHQMPSTVDDKKQASNCECCKQCVGDCASVTVVIFNLLQFSDSTTHEIFSVTADLLFTHITSPPSRPPQVHYV